MRIIFLLLLLINLLAYLWGTGYLGTREPGREPERLSSQLKPERLRVLAPSATNHCQQLVDLDEAQLQQLRKQFDGNTDVQVDATETVMPGKYWLAIAAIESRELALRKQAELSKLGISGTHLVEDTRHGPFVLVLGDYGEAAAAQAQLDALAPKGIRSPRVITREAASTRYHVELTWPESQTAARRATVQSWLATLPSGSTIKSDLCATP